MRQRALFSYTVSSGFERDGVATQPLGSPPPPRGASVPPPPRPPPPPPPMSGCDARPALFPCPWRCRSRLWPASCEAACLGTHWMRSPVYTFWKTICPACERESSAVHPCGRPPPRDSRATGGARSGLRSARCDAARVGFHAMRSRVQMFSYTCLPSSRWFDAVRRHPSGRSGSPTSTSAKESSGCAWPRRAAPPQQNSRSAAQRHSSCTSASTPALTDTCTPAFSSLASSWSLHGVTGAYGHWCPVAMRGASSELERAASHPQHSSASCVSTQSSGCCRATSSMLFSTDVRCVETASAAATARASRMCPCCTAIVNATPSSTTNAASTTRM